MVDVLLIVDYQKSFNTGHSLSVRELVGNYKWDKVIQTMWFNEINSLFMKNLDYESCQSNGKDTSLVSLFPGAYVFPRIAKYSCASDDVMALIKHNTTVYVAGLETDACVLATCFDLFDKGVNFRIVSDCVATKHAELDEAAKLIIRRQFGKETFVVSDKLPVNRKGNFR